MNIGIVGATGMIGQRIVAEAVSRNHNVTALTHDPTYIPRQQGAVTWKVADVLQADSIAAVLPSLDALVSAYGPGPRRNSGGQHPPEAVDEAIRRADTLVTAANNLLKVLEKRPALRLIIVGGAASLEIQPGVQAADSPIMPEVLKLAGLPEGYIAVIRAHGEALNLYRTSNRNWTYFSPAAVIAPGQRTGRFRLGTNQLIVDEKGQSRISCEDYAVALVDEIELPRHVQRRFTIGY
jgi:putative NADH-flavin reductase